MKFLAVDIGASSGRTIVATIDGHSIEMEETHRFENSMVDVDGSKRWDVQALVEEIKSGIAKSGDVDAIGLDTWGVDYGLIDADGELLEMPYAYRDSRHELGIALTQMLVSKVDLYKRNGLQEMPFNTIFQLMAQKEANFDLIKKADRMLLMPELIIYLLTGEACSEYSICSTTGLLDAKKRDWDWDLIETLGLPKKIFGEIKMPGEKAGSYNGTPIFLAPMHDTASAVAAVPDTEDGDWAYLSSGTWSLIGAELDEPILNDAAVKANFTNEGGVNGLIRFLKNVNGMWLIQECRRIWKEEGKEISFEEIAKAAEDSDFRDTIDPNDPRYMAPENMVETIRKDLASQGKATPQNPGDYARCCYESLAAAYKRELDKLQEVTGKTFQRLHVVGGGCQARLLNQLTADQLQIPVIAGPVEATALGNICVQAMANGAFKDQDDFRQAIATAFPVETYQPGSI